jgi:hypothetical protein
MWKSTCRVGLLLVSSCDTRQCQRCSSEFIGCIVSIILESFMNFNKTGFNSVESTE